MSPVFSRKYLRQTLGRSHLRDTQVRLSTNTTNLANGSINVMDTTLADLSLSGQGLYVGAWLLFSSAEREYRIGSFNIGSGALWSQANSTATIFSAGQEYEIHTVLPPSDKDRAIDETVKRLWTRQEVGIDSVEKDHTYPLPPGVISVLDCYYFASPSGTLDRDRRRLTRYDVVATPTGVELRIDPALMASQQIVLDAILSVSLGTGDTATVNIPDERLVLFGAEAQCWDLLVRRAPRGTADEYRRLRDEAARQFNLLSARFKTPVDRPIRLDSPGGRVF